MYCPSCEESIYIEDWEDNSPFQCESCDQWLQLDIDEGTYYGAQHRTLILLDEDEV